MRRISAVLGLLLPLMLLLSCQDRETVLTPDIVPQLVISDGARGGNPRFFWLQPTVPNAPATTGVFDATVLDSLTVEVCELNAANACGAVVASMTSTGNPFSARVRLDAAREYYLVYWNTATGNINPAVFYRARVLLRGVELGFLDVDVVATRAQVSSVNTAAYAGVAVGDQLTLRFRVEQGAAAARMLVAISSPVNGAVAALGSTVSFTGSAVDPTDGALTGAALSWRSDTTTIGTGTSFTRTDLPSGAHVITLTATNSRGQRDSAKVNLTIGPTQVTVPQTLNVPFRQTASLPITLLSAAPAGGDTVIVTSSDSAVVSVLTRTVVIPAGQLSANATLAGSGLGPANITVTSKRFGRNQTVATSRGVLQIAEASITVNPNLGTGTFTVELRSASAPEAAPAGGVIVNLSSDTPACAAVPAADTIPAGQVSAKVTVSYGGTATRPCSAKVSANAQFLNFDDVNVEVNSAVSVVGSPLTLGLGLQSAHAAMLETGSHPGATVRIRSLNPAAVLVAPNATTAGRDSIDVAVSPGASGVPFFVQSVGSVAGTATIEYVVITGGFNKGQSTVTLEVPRIELTGITDGFQTTALSGNVPFGVAIGIGVCTSPDRICTPQSVRFGATVAATVSNSAAAVGQIVRPGEAAQLLVMQIPAGQASAAGVSFDPLGAGTSRLSVTAPGFTPAPVTGDIDLTVTAHKIFTSPVTVGAGLQVGTTATLETGNHGGVNVVIKSADPARALVSPDATTAGRDSIIINVPNTGTSVSFVVQGLENQTGTAQINFSAAGFAPSSATVTLEQPKIEINGINDGFITSTFSAKTAFFVTIGIGGCPTYICPQAARIGGPGVPVTAASTDSAVARIVRPGAAGQAVQLLIPQGQSATPSTVLNGSFEFHPLAGGSTKIRATSPGFMPTPVYGEIDVTVDAPDIYVSPVTIGAGLQVQVGGSLETSNHGGITVRITSADSNRVRVSRDATTAGSRVIDVFVPNGQGNFTYFVQGMEQATGAAQLAFTAPLFQSANAAVTLETAYLSFAASYEPLQTTSLSENSTWSVLVGLGTTCSYGAGDICTQQQARAGGGGIPVQVRSTASFVGWVVAASGSADSITVRIPEGQSSVYPVSFDPRGAGNTTLKLSAPGFMPSTRFGELDVIVTAPAITISDTRLGSGLQTGMTASLGANNHGGITVRISSSDPSRVLVAANHTVAGAGTLDVFVPNGQGHASFYVQGLEAKTGTITLTASGAGFTDGTAGVTLTTAHVGIGVQYEPLQTNTLSTNTQMYAVLGVDPNCPPYYYPGGVCPQQAPRAGGPGVRVLVKSSNPTVGGVALSGAGTDSVYVNMPPMASSAYFEFDPKTAGTAAVSVSVPGFTSEPTLGSVDINVAAAAMTTYPVTVGAGLQTMNYVYLSGSSHGGDTIRIRSLDPSKVLVAANHTTAGSAQIDLVIPDGQSYAQFIVQGVEGQTGAIRLDVSATKFANTTADVAVVQPLIGIVTAFEPISTTTLSGNHPLQVTVGINDCGGNGYSGGVCTPQAARVGGGGISLKLINANSAVGTLMIPTTRSDTLSLRIGEGLQSIGGVEFDPANAGDTQLRVMANGFQPSSVFGEVDVRVTAPTIYSSDVTVASALQASAYAGFAVAVPTATTVRVTSSNPSLVLVSPAADSVGRAFIDLNLAAGQSYLPFTVQALDPSGVPQTGTTTVIISAPGFVSDTITITVVQPAIELIDLPQNVPANNSDVLFGAKVGVPCTDYRTVCMEQALRTGATARTLTFSLDNPAVARLKSGTTVGSQVTVNLNPGQSQSNAGLYFDPIAVGNVNVTVNTPAFYQVTFATRSVIIH